MLAINVIAASTTEEAAYLATSQYIYYSRMLRGVTMSIPLPCDPKSLSPDPLADRALEARIVGNVDTVRRELRAYQSSDGVDELMIQTMVHDHAARMDSFTLSLQAMAE